MVLETVCCLFAASTVIIVPVTLVEVSVIIIIRSDWLSQMSSPDSYLRTDPTACRALASEGVQGAFYRPTVTLGGPALGAGVSLQLCI